MTKRLFNDKEFKVRRRSLYIYYTIYDSLVFIWKNSIECANDHLKKCIAKRYSKSIQKNTKKGESVSLLNSDKIDEIFMNYSVYAQCGYHKDNTGYEFRKSIAYQIFISVKTIQRTWRTFKLKPKSLAK